MLFMKCMRLLRKPVREAGRKSELKMERKTYFFGAFFAYTIRTSCVSTQLLIIYMIENLYVNRVMLICRFNYDT